MSLVKKLALVGLVAAVIAFAIVSARRSGRGAPLSFTTAKVERGRLVSKVTATGTLSALVTVQVGSQVSGRIAELHADFNSTVKKGQLIAKIDPALFVAAVEQSRANLFAARGQLHRSEVQALDARRIFARTQELFAQRLVSQADVDTAEANEKSAAAQIDASRGAVQQAAAALHQAQINFEYTNIVSPINGTVISRSVDVGQTVAASLSAPTLFTIAEDLRKMQVDTNVAEADVGKLEPGRPALFTVDAYPTTRFSGTIRQIRNAPQTVQNVVTYDAVIDVANPELKLRPGMTANVTVIYAEHDDVLRLPNAALRFRPPPELLAGKEDAAAAKGERRGGGSGGDNGARREGGRGGPRADGAARGETGQLAAAGAAEAADRRTVWMLRGTPAKPAALSVRIGLTDGTSTEVEGDLHEGDEVITSATGGESAGGSGGGGGGPPGGGAFRRML